MKEVYEDFYKIHSCNTSTCENLKNDSTCSALAETLCVDTIECNDCLLDTVGLAQAYVPYQTDLDVMEADCSLVLGTAFKQLVKPHKKFMNGGKKNA